MYIIIWIFINSFDKDNGLLAITKIVNYMSDLRICRNVAFENWNLFSLF